MWYEHAMAAKALKRAMSVGVWVCVVAGGGVGGCTGTGGPPPQDTRLHGQLFGRTFGPGASAAFLERSAPLRSVVVTVANRSNTCDATRDPTDVVDPRLVLAVSPDQTGNFQVGPGAGDRFATATLFTYEDMDGGLPDGASPVPVVFSATGGEINVQDYVPGDKGVFNADVILIFGDDGGFAGTVGAVGCN